MRTNLAVSMPTAEAADWYLENRGQIQPGDGTLRRLFLGRLLAEDLGVPRTPRWFLKTTVLFAPDSITITASRSVREGPLRRHEDRLRRIVAEQYGRPAFFEARLHIPKRLSANEPEALCQPPPGYRVEHRGEAYQVWYGDEMLTALEDDVTAVRWARYHALR